MTTRPAVLLLGFGGPAAREEVRPFIAQVLEGVAVPPGRLDEVARHYDAIGGGSPFRVLTARQADGLAALLKARGTPAPVYVGMRYGAPALAETLARMAADGVRRAAALVLAPQRCDASRAAYERTMGVALDALGPRAPAIAWAGPWFDHPLFVRAVADRAREALARIPEERRGAAAFVFTAHSIPEAMPGAATYAADVAAGARAVAESLGRPSWRIAYQSRSGDPRRPWLGPDVTATLEKEAAAGTRDAVVVPVGFVSDHVEVLYDLDIEARAAAEAAGLRMVRAGTVGDHPDFLAALADVADEVLRREETEKTQGVLTGGK